MSIIEQVKELKWYASYQDCEKIKKMMYQAADTIESLSAKLQAANMGQSAEGEKVWRYCKECKHYTPLPNGVRGGKRGHCKKRYPRNSRSGCVRACKMFSEKDSINEP